MATQSCLSPAIAHLGSQPALGKTGMMRLTKVCVWVGGAGMGAGVVVGGCVHNACAYIAYL